MTENTKDMVKEIQRTIVDLSKEYPEETGGFMQMLKAVNAPRALSTKDKEIIAVSLSVATRCHWCIAFHTHNALKAGATREEIIEACFVAVTMAGGPALMYMQLVLKAIEDFKS